MRNLIDLDVAVVLLEQCAERLREAGCEVPSITWRDQGLGWPPPLLTDRAAVLDPDSIGIHVRCGEREGMFVLFKGGWADLEFWTGAVTDPPVVEAPGADDPLTMDAVAAELDRFVSLFMPD